MNSSRGQSGKTARLSSTLPSPVACLARSLARVRTARHTCALSAGPTTPPFGPLKSTRCARRSRIRHRRSEEPIWSYGTASFRCLYSNRVLLVAAAAAATRTRTIPLGRSRHLGGKGFVPPPQTYPPRPMFVVSVNMRDENDVTLLSSGLVGAQSSPEVSLLQRLDPEPLSRVFERSPTSRTWIQIERRPKMVEHEGGTQKGVRADVRAVAAFAHGRRVEEVSRRGVDSQCCWIKWERQRASVSEICKTRTSARERVRRSERAQREKNAPVPSSA